MTALEPMVREVIAGVLDDLSERDDDRRVADFSGPFPVEIISRMLGVPDGERQQIREWLDLSLHREPGEMDPTPRGSGRLLELVVYFHDLRDREAAAPGDDMLTRLTEVTVDRGDGTDTGLTDNEIAGFAGAARRCRGGDGHEARGQRRRALRPSTPTSGARSSTTPVGSRVRSRRSSGSCPRRSTRAATRRRSACSTGGRVPAGFPVLLITGAATRDPGRSIGPTTSTSTDRVDRARVRPRRAQLPAARRWPGWRAASPSRTGRPLGAVRGPRRPGAAG